MMTDEMKRIIENARPDGWVLEPDAKRLLSLAGLGAARYAVAATADELVRTGNEIGYPLVAKIVSPRIMHKSDVHGVVVGIKGPTELADVFPRFAAMDGFAGVLVEEMVRGVEAIAGAKMDEQFGPMVLFGVGGTGVEIYRDTSLRMAPLTASDAESMLRDLKGRRLFEGYRGATPVNRQALIETLCRFSELVVAIQDDIESIDLNPLICAENRCIVADARIILRPR